MLVDTSQAMEPHIANTRAAVKAFIRWLHGEHEIALFTVAFRRPADAPRRLHSRHAEAGTRRGTRVLPHWERGVSPRCDQRGVRRASGTGRRAEGDCGDYERGPEFSARHHTNVLDTLRNADVTLHSFVLTRRRPGLSMTAPANGSSRSPEARG